MGKLYIITKTTLTDLDSSRHDLREATQAEIDAAASEQMRQDAAVGRAIKRLHAMSACSEYNLNFYHGVVTLSSTNDEEAPRVYADGDTLEQALRAAGLMEEEK